MKRDERYEKFTEDFGRQLSQAATQPPPRRSAVVPLGVVAVLLIAAVAVVGTTRSSPPRKPAGPSLVLGQAPVIENEGGKLTAAMMPDEYLDLKQSSARPVTVDQVRRAQAQSNAVDAAAANLPWTEVGPSNIGGRVVDLVADRNTAGSLYVAVSGGGVWKSTDAGTNFFPVWPASQTQAMGAIAQGPDGTLWAGTGEANPPGGGLTYFGDGMYRSTDGGATWEHWGLRESESIGRIAVDPTNPDRVFVAAAGHVARSAGQRGIYRVTDGGKNWQLVLAPPNATTGGIDVAIDPKTPSRVYASLWDHKRNNGARTYGGIGSGLFRSEDGGDTWTRLENITGPLASYDVPCTGCPPTGLKADASLGRIGVAVAPSDPSRVYVAFGSPYGPDKGFYVSDDYGTTFRLGGRAYQTSSGYQWWFGRLWVDPLNKDHLFNADVNLRVSNNGGTTWSAISGPHADQHAMDWDLKTPNRVYLGNDAGIYRSATNGNSNWVKGVYQPWNQSYHMDVAEDNPARLVTGLQDNGSVRTYTATNGSPTNLQTWNSYGGGDGHWTLIDPTNSKVYYECFQPSPPNQSCAGFQDGATSTTSWNFSNTGFGSTQRWTTDTPIAIDPNNSQVVYVGGTRLGRSLNQGRNSTVISPPDPGSLPGPVPPDENDLGPFYANEYATISSIAPAKSATPVPYANTIYVGTDTGRVWKTTDAGVNWTWLDPSHTVLPDRWVNAVVVDPDNENHVYVAFSGYREGDDAANVYETRDGGTTWTNISQNLPNGPVEMIIYDHAHDVLFAATDVGVFDHKDNDQFWYKVSIGLPQVPVLDVKLSGDGKTLFAATFGRSIWKLGLSVDAVDGGGAGTGGTVPATLSLSLGAPASFGNFVPGVAQDYAASTTANVISTAGDAALSVADPSATATGHLVNGSFSLPSAFLVKASSPAGTGGAFATVGGSSAPATLLNYPGPASNDPVTIDFQQHIGATDPLRTGNYSKTLTFTLSTTTP